MRGSNCQEALHKGSNGKMLGYCGDDVEREEEEVLSQDRSLVEC